MVETLSVEQPANENHMPQPPAREAALRTLLPYDYEYARDSGLIDLFYYDLDTGYDGLMHTLGGTLSTRNGSVLAEGFHHEPSGEALWPHVITERGEPLPVTRVDREHLTELPGHKRREFREFPFHPYRAQVVINGLRKVSLHEDGETGEKTLQPAKSTMYPKEYDALAVMQAVRIAYENRDLARDEHTEHQDHKSVSNIGYVPLIDGKTMMPIRLVLDATTKKIITAWPIMNKTARMSLTAEDISSALYGNLLQ